MNETFRRVLQAAGRIIDKCSKQDHSLLFQHGILVWLVCFSALLSSGEWLEEIDMYCLRRLDLIELSPNHQDWGRCENSFYSTALKDKPSPQRFHPWIYNKLRMFVHVSAAVGLLLLSRAVLLIFQNERVVKAQLDFDRRVRHHDGETRWEKRHLMVEMLRHNGSLGLYAGDAALALFFLLLDTILMTFVLLTFNPWEIIVHLGKRNIVNPNDTAIITFPPLAWCDVYHETGRLEGSYSYNCEVGANISNVVLVVFLSFSLTVMLLKTMVAVVYLVVPIMPFWRREALGIKMELSKGRTIDLYHLGHYTTLSGFLNAVRNELQGRLHDKTMQDELFPGIYSLHTIFNPEAALHYE